MKTFGLWTLRSAALAATVALTACSSTPRSEAPRVDSADSTHALKQLPRRQGPLIVVAIYEFRSNVGEIPARSTTDMFTTALVQSGQFRVVERARLNEGVIREKQLNAQGLSSGKGASQQLLSARYVFEGVISEANAGELQRTGALRVAGAEVGASKNRDVIGIDVRVVDAATSEIVSVVTVRKAVLSDSKGVSGTSGLLGTMRLPRSWNAAFVPDVQLQQQRKESLDVALRSAIDQAVIELSGRFPQ